MIPYGELAPDAMETAAGILMTADGVMPLVEGYGPSPSIATPMSADPLPGTPRGVISMFQRNGSNVVFAFTDDACYQLDSTYGWTLIQNGFSLTSGDDWSLAQYGIYLLATNTTQGLMQYNIETGGTFTAIPSAGAPREIFVCANYVVALDCEDDNGDRDNRLIRTSVLGNQTDFIGPGSDYQQVEDGGGLIGGGDLKNNAALILQENSVRLMQFGGNATGAFSLLKVADGRGSVGRRSIVFFDGVGRWLSTDGFCEYAGGGLSFPGAGKIDQTFLGNVDISRLAMVRAALDPINKVILWLYQALNNPSETVYQNAIGYSWQFRKWFTRTGALSFLTQIATPGITLDAMGTNFGVLDDIDILLDSRFFQGGQPVFAALDENYRYATFTGSSLEATLETGTQNSIVSGMINRATPIDNATTGALAVGVKFQLSDPLVWKPGSAKTAAGYVNLRASGLNVAFRRTISAGDPWTYAKGIDHLQAARMGTR